MSLSDHRTREFRACDVCRALKIRCNKDRPACTQCVNRKLVCHYSTFQLPPPRPRRARQATPWATHVAAFTLQPPQPAPTTSSHPQSTTGSPDSRHSLARAQCKDVQPTLFNNCVDPWAVVPLAEAHLPTSSDWVQAALALTKHYASLQLLFGTWEGDCELIPITSPWLLAGTTLGPQVTMVQQVIQAAVVPRLQLTSLTDFLFHTSTIHHLLYRFCRRIYPALGELYYQRFCQQLRGNAVRPAMLCSIMAYESLYMEDTMAFAPTMGLLYHSRAREFSLECLQGGGLDGILTLIQLGDNEAAFASSVTSDQYLTLAIRRCQQLRLHLVDAPGPQPRLDLDDVSPGGDQSSDHAHPVAQFVLIQEIRRFVWWQAYYYHCTHALVFNTVPLLSPHDFVVNLPNQTVDLPLARFNHGVLKTVVAPTAVADPYPALLPEYVDVYPWTLDEQALLLLTHRIAACTHNRTADPMTWVLALPQLNVALDTWLTNVPLAHRPEGLLTCYAAKRWSERSLLGAVFLRYALLYLLRIKLNCCLDFPQGAKVQTPAGRRASRQRCWQAALAIRDLLHRAKLFPVPCHNLIISGALYAAARVCLAQLTGDDSGDPQPDWVLSTAEEFATEVIRFLKLHAAYYPLNARLVQILQAQQQGAVLDPEDVTFLPV
ncbi:hypothetical protein H4R34_001151 [Dimargaris verticillata]|uniref:Zn(2)-C6 fungal-type domain-containing protein n=1 Tax=Dimargaris verticillata TaxID=2761393 RepID=A0A9W8B4Z5_9FUNG|nr:hypothetical protein H4R34_001151 [Dimargaris verticillata]